MTFEAKYPRRCTIWEEREANRAYREQVWARRDAENLKPIWPAEIGAPE